MLFVTFKGGGPFPKFEFPSIFNGGGPFPELEFPRRFKGGGPSILLDISILLRVDYPVI